MGKGKSFAERGGVVQVGSNSRKDLPARLNVKLNIKNKSPEAMLEEFRRLHVNDEEESAVAVDEQGFVTQYKHGNKRSVSIEPNENEIVFHNHPHDSALSDGDLFKIAGSKGKGVVASGKSGDYIFVKNSSFKSEEFIKGLNKAINDKIVRTDTFEHFNADIDIWLNMNQRIYKYKYKHNKR